MEIGHLSPSNYAGHARVIVVQNVPHADLETHTFLNEVMEYISKLS
ncbi:hypothetical protein [Hyphomicrobium denitrificans]|nr:hypothetical protein [Hyphomicrobium denitrificans]